MLLGSPLKGHLPIPLLLKGGKKKFWDQLVRTWHVLFIYSWSKGGDGQTGLGQTEKCHASIKPKAFWERIGRTTDPVYRVLGRLPNGGGTYVEA